MINSTNLARSLVRQLIELGVCDFVVSPGSRNAPLLIALGEAADKSLIELHVKIDERGAAYFALGLSKAADNYVAVVCTSGTAAANFLPAVLESVHGRNKVIFITADRPAKLRNTGANQTTNQINLYPFVKTHDLTSEIEVKRLFDGQPIHLNIQFEEPLVDSQSNDWLAGIQIKPVKNENIVSGELRATSGVVVIGHDRAGYKRNEIANFISKLNWPVVSEDPLSFPTSIAHASLFLSDETVRNFLAPENIISIGRTTLSRSINNFINCAKKRIVIDPRIKDIDFNRQADELLSHLPSELVCEQSDQKIWQSISARASAELQGLNWSEQLAAISICENLPDDSALYVGSSRPIRDIEAFAKPRNGIEVFANRGLAGIDGNISTIFGIAEKFSTTYAILGDLAFLHDISALASVPKKNLKIFVIDNNGGGIFSTLPQASAKNFEKLFGTPHNLELSKIVSGFGISSCEVNNLTDLQAKMTSPVKGVEVIIVKVPNRNENAEQLMQITQNVSSAVRMGINLA